MHSFVGKLPMRTFGKQKEGVTIMPRISRVFCLFLLVTATAAAQPTISSLSNSTAARSSRAFNQAITLNFSPALTVGASSLVVNTDLNVDSSLTFDAWTNRQ